MSLSSQTKSELFLQFEERVLWSGAPATGLKFRASDISAIPASILFFGFAIFWEYNVIEIQKNKNDDNFGYLFGLPFLFIGFYSLIGRFFVDAINRTKTKYFITSQKIIIQSGIFNKQTKILPLQSIAEITITENKDGSGTLSFNESSMPLKRYDFGEGGAQMIKTKAPAFEFIQNVRSVYELIQTQKEK